MGTVHTVCIPLSLETISLGWAAFRVIEDVVDRIVAESMGEWVESGSCVDLEYQHHMEFRHGHVLTSFRYR